MVADCRQTRNARSTKSGGVQDVDVSYLFAMSATPTSHIINGDIHRHDDITVVVVRVKSIEDKGAFLVPPSWPPSLSTTSISLRELTDLIFMCVVSFIFGRSELLVIHPFGKMTTLWERMATVKHKILVLSGKGGVGKSTFSAQLAFALSSMDYQVGLLDIDICGPSIPKMLGLEGQGIHQSNLGWSPVYVDDNLGVMSIGFMLPHPDEAVIWRGPRKNGIIKQFLKDASGIDGAIIVSTPQQVSLIDVRKEVSFCKKVGLRVLGVVENMSGLRQPVSDLHFMKVSETGEERDVTEWALEYMRANAPEILDMVASTEIFDSSRGGAAKMCLEMDVPFLGKVPMDPQLGKAAEEGRSCFIDKKCRASQLALKRIVDKLVAYQTEAEIPLEEMHR
ncbi:hypothetical protein Scep_013906 [Stephania cephalantha]|uniref:Cytosolic Fe-S cluster assembly factor NBP35 n=1 Tax=Stephania cephalantha TaxID=152367 RepID=A0AAP0J119_9MAGN